MTAQPNTKTTISEDFIQKACLWSLKFDTVCILDNNRISNALGLQDIEFALAAGVKDELIGSGKNDFDALRNFTKKHEGNEAIFGYLTYDLKNQIERLQSQHPDPIGFAPMYFFVPQHLILIDQHGQLMIMSEEGNEILKSIEQTEIPVHESAPIQMEARVSKKEYLENADRIRQHIIDGDVYELNYCVEFFAGEATIDPIQTYFSIRNISPTPFGSFLKWNNRFLMCASPERFLKKTSNLLYSQPIKGTVRRSADPAADNDLKEQLRNSEKERAENLMIVDLVRNDLAKSSETGSVQVNELYGIYSFRQVHQMISTVSSTLKDEIDPVSAIENAFPMGSMTGAPKVMAMQLIEQYEQTRRGLYSGSVGYIAPNTDFDFNVVIRSIQYNAETNYVNFEVGSAITFDSDPEHEYEECLLKAQAMLKALHANIK